MREVVSVSDIMQENNNKYTLEASGQDLDVTIDMPNRYNEEFGLDFTYDSIRTQISDMTDYIKKKYPQYNLRQAKIRLGDVLIATVLFGLDESEGNVE